MLSLPGELQVRSSLVSLVRKTFGAAWVPELAVLPASLSDMFALPRKQFFLTRIVKEA